MPVRNHFNHLVRKIRSIVGSGTSAIRIAAGAFALASFSLVASAPALAHGVDQVDASQVMNILESKGSHSLELSTDSHGDPLISGKNDGVNFTTLFYNCENTSCGAFQFRAIFTNEAISNRNHKLDLMNQYNSSWQFGKGYVNENGDFVFEISGSARGGIELKNVDTYAGLFFGSIDEFKQIAGWR